MLYVYTSGAVYDHEISGNALIHQIWRVDPDPGSRERVWRHRLDRPVEGYGVCFNGDPDDPTPLQLPLEGDGFEVGSDGSFFISTVRNANPALGVGFIEISPDGSECRVVSMNPGRPGNEGAPFSWTG